MTSRTYKHAVQQLNTLQSNAATLEAVRAAGTAHMNQFAIPEMIEYLSRIGHSPADLNALNVIHVTGTKGKGSTSAFLSSILRKVRPDWKIGLYTSPHLVAVRERIRINGNPLSEQDFARYFFQVWDKLEMNPTTANPATSLMPSYFKFLTLMAFHTLLDLKVDATILEVGVGGTYDSTNIVPEPVVTGVSSLGLDHVSVLGKTIEEIAWQKGGIFKAGVPAFTVPQSDSALHVLQTRAEELQASSFNVADAQGALDCSDISLGLAGAHQITNAMLAVHLANSFLQSRSPGDASISVKEPGLPPAFVEGLKEARWPGRCQTVPDPKFLDTTWYLDGAHTIESLTSCLRWFVAPNAGLRPPEENSSRILIFNCTNGRSGANFLKTLRDTLSEQLRVHSSALLWKDFFDHVIFCTNVTYQDGGFKGDLASMAIPEKDLAELVTQHQLASAWRELFPEHPDSHLHVLPSIEHAIQVIRKADGDAKADRRVLVAGSLHLVGGVIEVAGLSNVAL